VTSALAALVTCFVALRHEIHETHKIVNSRMDELLALTRQASRAEGAKQEHDRPTTHC
jgi:hypothetical protein